MVWFGSGQARNAVESIKEGMRELETTMSDPRGQIEGFDVLMEVSSPRIAVRPLKLTPAPTFDPHSCDQLSLVHRRFVQTLETVNSFQGMYSQLSHISELLSSDRADPYGPAPNLLAIHYHLSELETFRNETLAQAKRSKATTQTRATLEQYFGKLGETIDEFEAYYFGLVGRLVELGRRGSAPVAVKIAKIAEVEGNRDQKAIAIKMFKKSGNADVAARFKSLAADARTIKHYRSKVMDAIRDSAKIAIAESFKEAGENGVRWLDELDWIYEDLIVVKRDLESRFPPDWNVGLLLFFSFFPLSVKRLLI